MDIVLQGAALYPHIKDWNGTVDVHKLNLFQMKRLVGLRSRASLFKKLIKIMKREDPPVDLPAGLDPEQLDLIDFIHILVGIVAMSKGRQYQRTFTCPHCKKLNPRVLDLVKIFKFRKPKLVQPEVVNEKIDGQVIEVLPRNITVKDYITIQDKASALTVDSLKDDYNLDGDEEDVEDFAESLVDIGLVSLISDIKPAKTFEEKVLFFGSGRDEPVALYKKINAQVIQLSPDSDSDYTTSCSNCKKDIKVSIEASDYFFDLV